MGIAVGVGLFALIIIGALLGQQAEEASPEDKSNGGDGGGGNGGKKAEVVPFDKKAEFIPLEKHLNPRPPTLDPTFDHKSAAAVRWTLISVGIPNDQFSPKWPTGEGVARQFQRQYNSVAAACLHEKIPCLGGVPNMGILKVDDVLADRTLDGLEVAKRMNYWASGRTWPELVQLAHEAGY